MARFLLPLSLFIVLAGFLAYGLKLNPREVPSPLIGKPAPDFRVPQLHMADKSISPADMKGKVWLLNVWASWCVSCRQEHPLLVDLSRKNIVPIIGLNYKDQREAGLSWLREHGDPYVLSAFDFDGKIGIDFGVYGVPETFLIDKDGVIRYKHIGPLDPVSLETKLLPKIKELSGV